MNAHQHQDNQQRDALWCWLSFADLTADRTRIDEALLQLVRQTSTPATVTLTPQLLAAVLQLYLAGTIADDDLADWAHVVELRHDIDSGAVEGFIYALANAEQMGGISTASVLRMLALLTD